MAQNACNAFKAPPVSSNIDKPARSCSHCDFKNDSEKRQDLTCSCEDCTEAKTCLYYTKRSGGLSDKKTDACCAQSNPSGNPSTIPGFIGTFMYQLYNKFKSTICPITPSAASETKPKKECILEKCSCIRDQTYGIMTATLRKQESIVGIQKRAYLPENYLSESKPKNECVLEKCSCIGDQIYGIMTATLHKQESIVGIQKRAYLPENYLSETKSNKECALGKCTCMMHSDSCCPVQNKDKKESPNHCGASFGSEVSKTYHKQELPDYLIGAAGYVFDVPKICCHMEESSEVPKSCHKQESSEGPKSCHKQESSEVPKMCCHKQESSKVLKSCQKQESSEVPKICCHKQDSYKVPKSKAREGKVPKNCHKQESSEVPKICCHKQETSEVPTSGHKQESLDLMKGAAGYVFDIPKICCDKQESPNPMKGAAGYVFDVSTICCDKQDTPSPMNGAAGYVIELPKIDKDQRQCCKENKMEKDKKMTTNECNMCNASETSSLSETKTARLGSENGTQVFNINKLGSKRTVSDTMHICCKTKNVSDSQQYRLTNNAQGLFKNIQQPQENALKIENTLFGPTTQKKSYDCRESDKNKSAQQNILESSGCVTELQTCKTSSHEPANKIGINRLKAKGTASDSKYKLVKKRSCEAPGYVWVVPKHSSKHDDHKKQKCDCEESAKYKSDKPGYSLKQKNKINSYAFTDPAKRKPKLPECAHDIPICREIDNAERVWKNKKSSDCKCKKKSENEPFGYPYAHELPKCTQKIPSQKSNCVCRESTKNKSASPEGVQELAKCTHKSQSQKSSSECPASVSKAGKIQSESSGRVSVVPQETKKCCGCNKSAKRYSKSPHEAANNAEVFSINRLESNCNQPDTQSMCCKSMVGRPTNTTEVFESLDILHQASKIKFDLCKDILKNQTDTIEVLKKIYLPQKSKVVSTCCSPNLTELSDTIKKYAATQPRSANLSAEVLVHMPEAEFNGCLSCNQSNLANKQKQISKSDIIKRLKEAYKACSCKICDCFSSTTSKSVKTDESKPYKCDKCLRSISSLETNEQPLCSCKPCDCVQCTKNTLNIIAGTCECGDCKTSINNGQSFFVAPVGTEENAPRISCTCSPCACIECGLVYPLTSNIVNDMSTTTNRHAMCRCEICLNESCDQSGLDSCKCQKHKVMSKPVEHDTHEFDIRTARIVHNTPMFQRVGRSDTIAMFAAIPGRYPTFNKLSNKRLSNTQACSCNECKCIFCVCQKDSIKSSELFSSNKAKSKSDFIDRYNNYEFKMPYECHIYKKIKSHDTWCGCATCDCINCQTSKVPENLHRFGRHRYSDGPYEQCSKKDMLGRILYPFKKGDVLTPSTHKLKVQNQIWQKQHLEEKSSSSIPKVTANTDSSSKLRDVDIFNELTSEFYTSNRKIDSITQANINMNDFNTKYKHKCKTFKCDAYMQERNKRRYLQKNIAIDNEAGSCFSDHSSSYYQRYGSKNLISRSKSRESSCNSSAYIYPEYCIQFTKGTAETSLKEDIIKLDEKETIKLDKYNIIQNSIEKHNVDKVSYDNMTSNENSSMINECYNLAGPTESNDNNSKNAHIASMRRNCKNSKHVQLNNQNDKHINFGNTVLLKSERNELQHSVCLKSSQSYLKMNNESREYMNAIHDFNEFHVARNLFYNTAEGNTSTRLFPIHDKRNTLKCPKQTTHSNLGNGAEILNVHVYRRVRDTLMEAKKFSLELIRLLKTYENANNEFENISEKLKLSHPI